MVVTEPGELLDLGIAPNDPLYIAVRDAFKQIPTVTRVFVGRRQVETSRITVAAASLSDYSIAMTWRDAAGEIKTAQASATGLPQPARRSPPSP
ncbi:hypothetical protein G6F35_017445 [Rhizopus arrhizus]|nr:hypothetical protein G6F35_017445 [Rhizopus arrhizus]